MFTLRFFASSCLAVDFVLSAGAPLSFLQVPGHSEGKLAAPASAGNGAKKLSLLQMQERSLPEVPSLLDKPTQVLQELSAKINSLRSKLSEAQTDNRAAVANQKAKYDATLKEQHENTSIIKATNHQLRVHIEKLMKENTALHKHATDLQEGNAVLRSRLLVLRSNFSTAQEFMAVPVHSKSNQSITEEKLSVLRELDEQDAQRHAATLHTDALNRVGGNIVLLQIPDETSNPAETVQSLGEVFQDLDRETQSSMATLNATFEEEFNSEDELQKALLEEQDDLNHTKQAQESLNERLLAAVTHLSSAKTFLNKQLQGMASYAQRMGQQ